MNTKLLLAFFTLTTFAAAQDVEQIPAEKVRDVALKVAAQIGTPADAPLSTDLDIDRAAGLKAGKAGLLLLPDKKLTAEAVAAAKESMAFGQLWMVDMVPSVNSAAP